MACVIGLATYFWIVDFPEKAHLSFYFLSEEESKIAVSRIQKDRGDVIPNPFIWSDVLKHFLDPKIYGFATQFFLLVSHDFDFSYEIPNRLMAELGLHISFVLLANNVSHSQFLTSGMAHVVLSLQSGMGFTENQAILLSAPVSPDDIGTNQPNRTDFDKPYYYAALPVLLSSRIGDSK